MIIMLAAVLFDNIFSHGNSMTNLNKLCSNGSCRSIYKFI